MWSNHQQEMPRPSSHYFQGVPLDSEEFSISFDNWITAQETLADSSVTESPVTTSAYRHGDLQPEGTVGSGLQRPSHWPGGSVPATPQIDLDFSKPSHVNSPQWINEAPQHLSEPHTQHTQPAVSTPPFQPLLSPQCDRAAPPPPSKVNSARDRAANKTLMNLRKAGWPYKDIVQELEKKHDVVATPNALAKRHRNLLKSQEEYLEPLPEAIKKVMPEIMDLIKKEAKRMKLSNADMESFDDLLEVIPSTVHNRILRKKKA